MSLGLQEGCGTKVGFAMNYYIREVCERDLFYEVAISAIIQ